MSKDWAAYFQTRYAPEDLGDAARAVLSRQVEPTQVIEHILLMDMISEMACKATYDVQGPKQVDVQVTSTEGYFDTVSIVRTSPFAAFGQARKLGLISDRMLTGLAEQSATASVVAQMIDSGNDPKGMTVQTVPLGFESYIRERMPQPGLLSRVRSAFR